MSGLLPPTMRETMLGNAQILEIFKVSKVGNIAGCRVTDGHRGTRRQCALDPRQRRHPRRQAEPAQALQGRCKEVSAANGMRHGLEDYQDMRAGDVIECYRVETIQRSL